MGFALGLCSMQHDVAITRTRTILIIDGPLVLNIDKSLNGGRPFDFIKKCALTPFQGFGFRK
jgi:hypothetical protein